MKSDILLPPFEMLPYVSYMPLIADKQGFLKTYPITLYTRKDHKIQWHGFAFAYFFYDKYMKKGLRIDYFTSFGYKKPQTYKTLLKEIYELAFCGDAKYIEVEAFKNVYEKVCFPSTNSICCGFCDPEANTSFVENDFKVISERVCMYCTIPSSSLKNVTNFSVIVKIELIKKLLPQHICYKDFNITLKKGKKKIGTAVWLPNLYSVLRQTGTLRVTFPINLKEAKVFAFKSLSDDADGHFSLLLGAMNYVKSNYNISKFYIGNLDYEKDAKTIRIIEEKFNGKKAYETFLLRKDL